MSFGYLLENRERPGVLTWRWVKVWGKRLITSPKLFGITLRRSYFKSKGANIGALTLIGGIELNGSAKNLYIGSNSVLGSAVHLALHERINIGSNVVINDGVQLLTASHDTSDASWRMFAQPIEISDYAWVARGAIILPGVRIGRGAVVGAGAVVSRDVPDYCIAVGNPAKLLDKRRTKILSYSPVAMVVCYEAWLGRS